MPHPWGLNIRDEVSGGLVSAAVAIPLAMGYGMFAFVSLGDKYLPTAHWPASPPHSS